MICDVLYFSLYHILTPRQHRPHCHVQLIAHSLLIDRDSRYNTRYENLGISSAMLQTFYILCHDEIVQYLQYREYICCI